MENAKPLVAVVMAAGKSTRMKSRTPKVLHPVAGRPVIEFILQAARDGCGATDAVVIVGYAAEQVRDHLDAAWGGTVRFATQEPQLGTGHAIMQAGPLLEGFEGDLLALAGDTPLVTADVLRTLADRHRASGAAATMLTALMDDPGSYGRVVRGANGTVGYIVEARDASADELAVREINTSIYCFQARPLFAALARLRPDNAQGEYYLTDVIAMLIADGQRVEAVVSPDPDVVMGVNTRVELAKAAAIVRARALERLMLDGVTVLDPASTYVDVGVMVGADTVLYPGTYLEGNTVVGEGCVIGPHTHMVDARVGNNVSVVQSRVVSSDIADDVRVGPFANVRAGTVLGRDARIGSFVETKKAVLGEGAKVAHLSYIGDATLGPRVNVGGGTITCNYDGRHKHPTTIGAGAFIGSNNTLVAPVTVGDGAYTAAGSTITDDVPHNALALGRARQAVKEGWAERKRASEDT